MAAEGFPYAVGCPGCGATAGHWCKRPSGHSGPMVAPHAARRDAAEVLIATEASSPPAEPDKPFTVKIPDLFGNVRDSYATEGELNGWRPTTGMLL